MTWLRFSWNASWRRPFRTLLTALGVAIAVGMAFNLLLFQRGYRRALQQEFERLGAHILVVPKGCPYDAASLALHGANWPCYLQESYLKDVRGVAGVESVAPALMSALFDSLGGRSVYVGVDTNMLALKPGWTLSGAFPKRGELLIGADAAKQLDWKVGQEVPLPGLTNARAKVSGLLGPTGSAEDGFIFLSLPDAQRQLKKTNQLTHVLVRLQDPNKIDRVVHDLRGCDAGMHMNVVPLDHLFETIQKLTKSTHWLLACAGIAALFAAVAGVAATQLIAVAERASEIGIMRALGASRSNIFGVISVEAVLISMLGAVGGVTAAFFVLRMVESALRTRLPFTPSQQLLNWDWPLALCCIAGGAILGALAALGPAWRAANLHPVLAMKPKLT